MKAPDEHHLDRQFREGLTGPNGDAEFREEDWAAMEDLLDKKPSKKPVPVWLYWFSGSIAAIFLLFFGWRLLNPVVPAFNKIGKVPVKKAVPVIENKVKGRNKTERKNQETMAGNHQYKTVTDGGFSSEVRKTRHKNSIAQKNIPVAADKILVENKLTGKKQNVADNNADASFINQKSAAEKYVELAATSVTIVDQNQNLLSNQAIKLDTSFITQKLAKAKVASTKEKKTTKPILKPAPVFSLAILTAPDVNGVNTLAQGKLGANLGLQFRVQLTRKWSVATGASYASKPYAVTANLYGAPYVHGAQNTSIDASCKVLDIPLNINYQVYGNASNAFSAGAGLSSYLMLRENYQFNYSNNTQNSYNIANQNKHYFSVLNLNATYQRRINSNFNILLQPYVKLPIAKIGYEKVDLQSAGLAVGVNWNFKLYKPK